MFVGGLLFWWCESTMVIERVATKNAAHFVTKDYQINWPMTTRWPVRALIRACTSKKQERL